MNINKWKSLERHESISEFLKFIEMKILGRDILALIYFMLLQAVHKILHYYKEMTQWQSFVICLHSHLHTHKPFLACD